MASFLIVGNNEDKIEEYIADFVKKNNISKFDQNKYIQEDKPVNKSDSVVKLLKKIKEDAYFRPVESSSKLTIIYKIDELSIPAQNSLLKIIEEPPNFLNIIITAGNVSKVLETIKSRCFIEYIEQGSEDYSEEEMKDLLTLTEENNTDTLKLSEIISTNKRPRLTINSLIYFLRKKMLEDIEESDINEVIRLKNIISALNSAQIALNNKSINTRNTMDFLLQNKANT